MHKKIQILKKQIKILEAQNKQWESKYAALNEQHLRIMKDRKRWKTGFIRLNDKYKAEKLKTSNQHLKPNKEKVLEDKVKLVNQNIERSENPYLMHFFMHN